MTSALITMLCQKSFETVAYHRKMLKLKIKGSPPFLFVFYEVNKIA